MQRHRARAILTVALPALVVLPASPATAQRVPEFVVWSASAALFAPLVAVPVKLGLLRLLSLEAGASRMWTIAALEWALWFPLAFVLFRSSRSSVLPLVALALFTAAWGVHWVGLAPNRWKSALLLSMATPVLVILLPVVAVMVVGAINPDAA